MTLTGSVGEGVLGPLDEDAEVNDDTEPRWCAPMEDATELRRGDEVPDE
jgi:hypothetical protein